jgi:hypothetical protein
MGLQQNILMIALIGIESPHLCAVFGNSARTSNKSLPLLALFTLSRNLSLDSYSPSSSSASSPEEGDPCSSFMLIKY